MPLALVHTGLALSRREGFRRLRGRRLGLLSHPAAVDTDLTHTLDCLLQAGMDVRLLFGPEHGWTGAAQDLEPVPGGQRHRGLPVVSLYGNGPDSLRPPPDALSEIQVLVVDLQDVGSRFYTFAATLRACMEACGRAGVSVLVLDRPNPLGGVKVEGPILRSGLRSFVGAFQVPVRHGLTLGELARWALREGVACELEVAAMEGWRRSLWFDQTGLPWVPPSPNMPTLDTATVYPGACLVEATNLSEGRGTTRPFETLGAPWLDGEALEQRLRDSDLGGVLFRAAHFTPAFQKHAGRPCHGVQVHVTDRERFEPFLCGLALIGEMRRFSPRDFTWRADPYEFVSDRQAIDLLSGTSDVRQGIESGVPLQELRRSWQAELEQFTQERGPELLYAEE